MYFSDIITLRTAANTQDEFGGSVPSYTTVDVWANKKSIARTEFYAANANGIDLTTSFEVHAEDYTGQTNILYATKEYDVIRTYQKGEGIVELVCSDKKV